jgi:hypothetical protein
MKISLDALNNIFSSRRKLPKIHKVPKYYNQHFLKILHGKNMGCN